MNSVFLNYNTSYFDLLSEKIPTDLNDGRLLTSLNGVIADTTIDCRNSSNYPTITAAPGNPFLNIGERRENNRSLISIDVGEDKNDDYSDFAVNLYPSAVFKRGFKFDGNVSRLDNADLWVNGTSGALKYRDRNVASVGDNVVAGSFAFFGSSTIGAIEDNGVGFSKGVLPIPLRTSNVNPSGISVIIDFEYQKIGKCVSLILRKHLFRGSLIDNPPGFQTQTIEGLLPEFLRPAYEVSCPLMIYVQLNGVRAAMTNQVGVLKIGGDIQGVVNLGNIEIRKRPESDALFNANAGNYDGWSSCSVSYFTA